MRVAGERITVDGTAARADKEVRDNGAGGHVIVCDVHNNVPSMEAL